MGISTKDGDGDRFSECSNGLRGVLARFVRNSVRPCGNTDANARTALGSGGKSWHFLARTKEPSVKPDKPGVAGTKHSTLPREMRGADPGEADRLRWQERDLDRLGH